MKYKRFEDTPVWQQAADLAAEMFEWTAQSIFRGKGDLANQLQRATLSISNNIAEGFERGTTGELLTFLYYARGSAGEVRSMLAVTSRMSAFESLHSNIHQLQEECSQISRQIHGWTYSLQNSSLEGQKHWNDAKQVKFDQQTRQNTFRAEHAERMKEIEAKILAQRPKQVVEDAATPPNS